MDRKFIDTDLEEDPQPPVSLDEVDESSNELSRKRSETTERVADVSEEIERLKLQQGELEHAKRELQELNRKQQAYETGKKSLIGQLSRQEALLRKEEVRLNRRLELVKAVQSDFADMLEELREIREEDWAGSGFDESLSHGLAIVEDMQKSYDHTLAKLEGGRLERSLPESEDAAQLRFDAIGGGGIGFWLKVGLGLAIPLAIGGLLTGGVLIALARMVAS